ncbi:hypothetical protein FB451DRAFT_1514575 [Mycena latifolia]|nr:hypothetical protein FB451DRAFT_1514575 [Mycena latifolia]
MDFDIGALTIPLFIGTVMNWALLGSLIVQFYIYFLAFPNDPRFSKFLVVAISVAELLQTMSDSRDTILTFGAGWGNFALLDDVGWAWFSVPVLGSTIASAGQMFFAWRIYIIGQSLIVPAVIAAVSHRHTAWRRDMDRCSHCARQEIFAVGMKPLWFAWLTATALADLIIVAGTVFYLLKARQPGFRRSTDAVLFRIIKVTVETGLLCALFALVDLSLFIKYNGNNYHLAVCIWLSKVYSNSIMVTRILNSRAHIGHEPPPKSTNPTHITDIAFQTRSHQTTVQVATEAGSIQRSEAEKAVV